MKKPQWTVAGIVFLLTVGLFALTQDDIFGAKKKTATAAPKTSSFSIESHMTHAREHLSAEQIARLDLLENSISRGNVAEQKVHVYHQLAKFWQDTVRVIEPKEWFEPYAWYTGEAARLENSEKSLTFAAHLFLNSLGSDATQEVKKWRALQAKDLFERSLKLNPANDSSQVGLGATYLFGGISDNPMEGISKIRQVVERDSTNVYAQITLARASVMSRQLDRAIERFTTVARLEPTNLEAILSLADLHEQHGDKAAAVQWYQKSLPLIGIPELKAEVERRITVLSK